MSKCDLEIVLDRPDRSYEPGEKISGFVGVTVNKSCVCRSLTITREWRTHGSGNRASGSTEEVMAFEGEWSAGEQHVHPFEFTVPNGPLTYHGHHLNVDWYIAARADIPWAFDPKAEEDFVVLDDPEIELDHGPRHLAGPDQELQIVGWLMGGIAGAFVLFLSTAFLCAGIGAWVGGEIAAGVAFTVLPLLFMGLGLFILFRAFRQPLAARRLGEVDFRVEPETVRGGEPVTVNVALTPRGDVEIDAIRARLWAQERCISGSGTRKRTHSFALWDETFEISGPRSLRAGERFEVQGQVHVPPDPAPSFGASENTLRWRVELQIDRKGWLDWQRAWLLTVRP